MRVKRQITIGVAVLVAAVAFATGRSVWRASHSMEQATAAVAHQGEFPARAVVLDKASDARFEPLSSPTQFKDAALFQGRLYVGGPSGLLAFEPEGALAASFRVGAELPPAPVTAVAAGIGVATHSPELWIATAGEGLLSFDGSRFTQVCPDGNAGRDMTAILPVASGRILIGTSKNGVLAWDGSVLTQLHASLAGLPVTTLAGTEADLWIGTIDKGVYRWHAGELDHFAEEEGLPDGRVLSIALREGEAFVGTALGVAEFRDGKLARTVASGYFAKALRAGADVLTIGTLEEGVVDVPLSAQRPRQRVARDAPSFGAVNRLLEMNGEVYALTDHGLFRAHDGTGYTQVLRTPGAVLADGNVAALSMDRAGRLWVGYFDRGLDIVEPGFRRATHMENEHVFCVNRIVPAADGGLMALGTANGLVLFDGAGQQKQVLTTSDGLIANNISDIVLRGDSRAPSITVATAAGITTIDPSGTSSIYAFHGLVNNHVYALGAAGTRTLAGTLGGLSIVDAGLVTASYTTANSGLKHNWITAIAAVGPEWFIGTYGAGVLKLDSSGRWNTFPDLRAPVEINQGALAATDRGVYAGTLGKGLAVYSRTNGRWTMLRAGLPSANVTAVSAKDGYVYVGTDNGLVRVEEARLGL